MEVIAEDILIVSLRMRLRHPQRQLPIYVGSQTRLDAVLLRLRGDLRLLQVRRRQQ